MSTKKPQIDYKTRKAVMARDGRACQKCGRRNALECHHINPRRAGGSNEPDNLIILCAPCHREWDAAEDGTHLTFTEWLGIPHYGALVAMYRSAPPELREAAYRTWQMFKDLRMLDPIE